MRLRSGEMRGMYIGGDQSCDLAFNMASLWWKGINLFHDLLDRNLFVTYFKLNADFSPSAVAWSAHNVYPFNEI
jgi:hypothetical protein